MFLENSRYFTTPTTTVSDAQGKEVTILKRRQLPSPVSSAYTVKNHDRLDLVAHSTYDDATKFWHIADANTELKATELTAETGTVINLPTS